MSDEEPQKDSSADTPGLNGNYRIILARLATNFGLTLGFVGLLIGGVLAFVLFRLFKTDFPGTWKDASVLLTGLFAVVGIFFDTRDKLTNRITPWGRAFFALTIMSITFGLVAQILENAESQARNAENQQNMIRLLARTQKAVTDLSRTMQPIEKPLVAMWLDVDCASDTYRSFCEGVLASPSVKFAHTESLFTEDLWDKIPFGDHLYLDIILRFYLSQADALSFINSSKCKDCWSEGDVVIKVIADNYKEKNIRINYLPEKKLIQLYLYVTGDVFLNSNEFMSVPDFKDSVVVASSPLNDNLVGLDISQILMITARGQSITAIDFKRLTPSTFLSKSVLTGFRNHLEGRPKGSQSTN
jgi:hypothetical protein